MAPSSSLVILLAIFFSLSMFSGDAFAGGCNGQYTRVATLYPFSLQGWQGDCFRNSAGYVTYTQDYGLGYIQISTFDARSKFCSDSYEFKVNGQSIGHDTYRLSITSPHTFDFDPSLRGAIREHGVEVYMTTNGLNCDQKQEPQAAKATEII
ncbi:uncharacterized protein LOC126661300 [Mercurialis annua]|uniref:uncharacterized protein LOC126661300 n=1 Tax=Mercurialis annua TaxID=3986 RepID=UPI002160054B|nr:uncharacterized protein LOC126661300 [Mercurialis annua]